MPYGAGQQRVARRSLCPSDASDEQRTLIQPLLPEVKTGGRPEKHPAREPTIGRNGPESRMKGPARSGVAGGDFLARTPQVGYEAVDHGNHDRHGQPDGARGRVGAADDHEKAMQLSAVYPMGLLGREVPIHR
jgi:hypothetical protein